MKQRISRFESTQILIGIRDNNGLTYVIILCWSIDYLLLIVVENNLTRWWCLLRLLLYYPLTRLQTAKFHWCCLIQQGSQHLLLL